VLITDILEKKYIIINKDIKLIDGVFLIFILNNNINYHFYKLFVLFLQKLKYKYI
jgi:hypothetical protein